MTFSLPFRIVLVHLGYTLVFTLGAGLLAIDKVQESYDRYSAEWKEQVETFRTEKLFYPMANEIARSLLLQLREDLPIESREQNRRQISLGLGAVLNGLPMVEGVFILDRDLRIQYVYETKYLDLAFTGDENRTFFASNVPIRKVVTSESGPRTHLLVPVYDQRPVVDGEGPRERLGSLMMVFGEDPSLLERVPVVEPPSVDDLNITLPVVIFVVAMAFGSLMIAALVGRPVNRLEQALEEFRARGFRGGLRAGNLGKKGELAATVQAINELGGQLEALDRRGRERDALLSTLSQALEDGMVAVGPDGEPRIWNPAALRIMAAAAPEPASDAVSGEGDESETGDDGAGDDDTRRIREALARNPELVVREGNEHGIGHREVMLALPDGTRSPAKLAVMPFETGPGEMGTLLLMRDLAALREVESHLLESSRYAVLAHLAAGLAHEIRNPLHSIGINAGVVEQYVDRERDVKTREAMSESLESISSETRRLTGLLNNYLGLMRPSQTPQPVDVRELCQRVFQLLGYTAGRSGVRLRLVGATSVPLVRGIEDRLQQAILNLVLNAIQAMPDGGEIHLETTFDGGVVRVIVADTGPGVPEELKDQLFNIRVTTKRGGSGLGLPLVRLIAENHGGTISYRTNEGQGASFILSLPVRQVA